jgi:hypothetical protein
MAIKLFSLNTSFFFNPSFVCVFPFLHVDQGNWWVPCLQEDMDTSSNSCKAVQAKDVSGAKLYGNPGEIPAADAAATSNGRQATTGNESCLCSLNFHKIKYAFSMFVRVSFLFNIESGLSNVHMRWLINYSLDEV